MPSTYLSKTGSGSGATTCTFSAWVKRSELQVTSGSPQCIWGWQNVSNSDRIVFHFNNGGSEDFRVYIQNSAGTATEMILATNRQFRDVNCWYHIVIEIDTTQATTSDRAKLYVNGVQETSFSTATYPTQNYVLKYMSSTGNTAVGNNGVYTYPYSGLLSHVHYIDGTAYDASTFGQFNSDGVWTPKADVSVTYGTNGFFLKFENSGSMGLDSSGNTNNFTVNGTLTQTVDTPSNVFATFNPLWRARVNNVDLGTYMSNGNTTFNSQGNDAVLAYFASTLGVTSGKWYWEIKSQSGSGGGLGVCYESMQSNTFAQFWDNSALLGCAIKLDGNAFNGKSGENAGALGPTYSAGDIYGFALDMDNYALYAHINGTYVNSGVPTSGASRTGSLLNLLTSGQAYLNSGEPVFPFFADLNAGSHAELKANFGNGFFGTTAVSSAGSNGNGAIFEYDVPTGYYALNTKNLATYG